MYKGFIRRRPTWRIWLDRWFGRHDFLFNNEREPVPKTHESVFDGTEPTTIPIMLELLQSKNAHLRRCALIALDRLAENPGNAEMVLPAKWRLQELLQDEEDSGVPLFANSVLSRITHEAAIQTGPIKDRGE
jgi:hypothetical protein